MEGLGVMKSFWAGKRVFVTGHTGFKGSWLSLCLQRLGAQVYGYALLPYGEKSLFGLASVKDGMQSQVGDVRDVDHLINAVRESQAEIVFHLAAQAFVRKSYLNPVETYSTNVIGTVHLLEAVRRSNQVRAVVNVTTDKCYENQNWHWAYREDDKLGGYDPYSSSKACSELVTAAYRQSYFSQRLNMNQVNVATARAGNVIGGGDFSPDRLIPDVLASFAKREPVRLRNHTAVRPWQHVLEAVSGYLTLAKLLFENGDSYAQAWNFGPASQDARSVEWIVNRLVELWGDGAGWTFDNNISHPYESNRLRLDVSKAEACLNWKPKISLDEALSMTVQWEKACLNGSDPHVLCLSQIDKYFNT